MTTLVMGAPHTSHVDSMTSASVNPGWMSFTVMSWNVRRFRGASAQRTQDVAEMVRDQHPDVFAIIEFLAKAVARDRRLRHAAQ